MKKLLFFVCAIFAFVACTQIVIEEQQGIVIDTPETLTVGFEDGDQTRIQLNEAQKTVWNKEDLASVFYRSDANQKWQYQGETGERVGDLKRVENAVGTTKTTKTVVVYPYSENYWLNTDSYAIEATLPATQYYAEGSYGVGSNLMVSQSEFTQFSLKSVCGWLKLQLTGNGGVVKSIKFRGNNEEQVAGLIYVDTATAEATLASEMGGSDDNNAGGNLVFDDTIFTELTLDCGEGVTLGEEVTTFYLSLPPQTFTNGFTVDIESEGYEILTLSTTNELVLERNMIQPMAVLAVEFVAPVVKPANNEIWYTNGSTTEATTPYKTGAFGVNIVSNTYDAEKECWVIKFDGDVMTIGDDAFYDLCSSLTSITIPDGVTTIGKDAFWNCPRLTSVYYNGDLSDWCNIDFYNYHSNPLKNGAKLYINNTEVTEITIPSDISEIKDYAFHGCSSLTSITIPDSVTTIGESAFAGCSSLTSVYYNGDLSDWCNIDFYNGSSNPLCNGAKLYINNTEVTEITIPSDISVIKDYTFYGCSSLTSVTIGDSVTTIGKYAFYDCSSLTSVIIGNSVTTIGDYAFEDCSSLTSITIPDSVTSIGNYAFYGCSSLTSITIPDSVTSIGYCAFKYCRSLTRVTIPDSVTTIGSSAFSGCTSLLSVYCMATTPPTGGDDMFSGNPLWRTINVPTESVDAYKSAEYWSYYASAIIGYDF